MKDASLPTTTVIDHALAGAAIRTLRQRYHIKSKKLALALEINPVQMTRLERGMSKWTAELFALAQRKIVMLVKRGDVRESRKCARGRVPAA